MAVTFIHTADWQLGMTRHFLDADAQARFTRARLDAVERIGALAEQHGAAFVVVCGDVFESNHLDRRTVAQSVEAMNGVPVPLYLVPGNHDPLEPGSVYHSKTFREAAGPGIVVLDDHTPRSIANGVELVGVPWFSKRPLEDLVATALDALPADPSVLRICAAHGGVDTLAPDEANPALIRLDAANRAIADGRIRYLGLGDRHSTTPVGDSGAVWYAGAPEPTDFVEVDPGHALLVTLADDGSVQVRTLDTAHWRFVSRVDIPMDNGEDVDQFESWLLAHADKARVIVRLAFTGTLHLRHQARLETLLDHAQDLFAAIQIWERHDRLVYRPDDQDLTGMGLSGFAYEAMNALAAASAGDDGDALAARDALALLYRLSMDNRE